MNIISSLIAVDPDTAEQVVEDLSRLFRASLQEAGEQVPLAEELSLCRRYVRIEQLRMGDRLRVNWTVTVEPAKVRIPLLTLQPLLENAIYHGVQPRAEGGEVHISIREVDERVEISLTNPLPEEGAEPHRSGNRMALENIRHRLQAIYGGKARLDAGPDNNKQYRVLISYPVTPQGGSNNAGSGL